MITHKVAKVPDATCETCSQCWEGECRAFEMSHSEEEWEHRKSGVMACSEAREFRMAARRAYIKSGKWTLASLPGGAK